MEAKDPKLGQLIHEYLLANKVENPAFFTQSATKNSTQIQQKMHELLTLLGLDVAHPSITATPQRMAQFFTEELFYGLDYANFPAINTSVNDYHYHSPLYAQDIGFNSTCEHHLVAISGFAHVAYIPRDTIVGLSKINRIVDFFAKRPQVQERVTRQIFLTLQKVLETEDVAIIVQAKHHCIAIRGIRDSNTMNTTVEFGGKFKSDQNLQATLHKLSSPSK